MENKTTNQTPQVQKPQKRPDDTSKVTVDGFVKIFDPKTRKVFVEQKA
jgi:hypothetical protein